MPVAILSLNAAFVMSSIIQFHVYDWTVFQDVGAKWGYFSSLVSVWYTVNSQQCPHLLEV